MEFFLQVVLILISARLLGEIAAKLSMPAVIGELLAGIILGPSLLDIVASTETIHLLAEIGVVLLLFEIGLETNIYNLLKIGKKATLAAIAGVIVPLGLGFFLSYSLFHHNLITALFIGGTLTATSIGITLRVMAELKRQNSKEAQIVLGAAIIDDIIGIILLSILYDFSISGEVHLLNIGKILLFILIFLLISPVLVKFIASLIHHYEKRSAIPGLLATSILSLLLLFAYLAKMFGAPEIIGGFATGLALSKGFKLTMPKKLQTDAEFPERIDRTLKPIIHLFVPIFFVNIGLTLKLKEISWGSEFIWIFSSIMILAAIIGKLTSGFVIKETKWIKWLVGIAMIPRGEVGLVFAEIGRSNGVFDQSIYAGITLVIIVTTLIAPIALRVLYKRAKV